MPQPPTPDPTLPDPSIYSFHGLATDVDARRRGVSDRIFLWSMGFVIGVLTGGAVVIGAVALTDDSIDPSGHEGQVYVVDSGRWVDADDHAAHTEHG